MLLLSRGPVSQWQTGQPVQGIVDAEPCPEPRVVYVTPSGLPDASLPVKNRHHYTIHDNTTAMERILMSLPGNNQTYRCGFKHKITMLPCHPNVYLCCVFFFFLLYVLSHKVGLNLNVGYIWQGLA